ncbi:MULTISPECIES: hypothetical protein [Burkholderiaceae]|jgi:hypothetical protein|uniref:Prohead protease n=2 Tax=cellular organisms TaxID=131567 RepID=A0A0N4USW7_ENTVE|nr:MULTISPECIES: hypothetical protein [Burkholderiaceae]VDD85039.1 unnamed protein product [Enterobius vermicularis]KAB0601827.1 hypothetical protein F7R19_15110 [Cupriavidus pauculus]MBR8498393.1 hypothetical protein [Burkholderia cenocepacia]UAL00258.1 hypothetical protein K8O84_02455 [Cupriavidus pauculus]CAB3970759.1 hypothetical protein BLA3211_06105 [Burkholderia aenigmatica]
MSYTILQSTKVFQLVDQDGKSIIASGAVSEDNNVSPKRYDTIYFNAAAKTKSQLGVETAHYAHSILTGCLQLKNGNGISTEDDVNTITRRFLNNLQKAKVVNVEKIIFSEKKVNVIFGEEGIAQLKKHEPKFRFYDDQMDGTWGMSLIQDDEDEFKASSFLVSDRTIEQSIELSKTDSYLPVLFKKGTITEDQLATLIKNLDNWVYGKLLQRTDTRLSQENYDKLMAEMEGTDNFRYIDSKQFLAK